MPDEIYEIIALAARYWFLFLMVLIAWRSYRWYARDRKKFKKRLKLLPDAGFIGELVVVRGDEIIKKGTCLPVSREGVLGYLRSNDVCVPMDGIANRHLWFSFDDTDGLRVEPFRGRKIVADGKELIGSRMRAFLSHGSTLAVGQAKMRLRMFSGFEFSGEVIARRKPLDETGEAGLPEELGETAHSDPVRRMHEIAAWQAMQEDEEAEDGQTYDPPVEDGESGDGQTYYPPEPDGDDRDDADEAFLPPMGEAEPSSYELQDGTQVFYPPVMDGEEPQLDENGHAPKSMYVGEDEAETAKRVLWDRYFKGGKQR